MFGLSTSVVVAAIILGQAASNSTSSSADPWVQVLQWGPAGVVLVLLGTGQLRFGREVKTAEAQRDVEKTRADKAEAWKEEQTRYNQEKIIPLMADTSRTLVEVGRALQITPVPPPNSPEAEFRKVAEELIKTIKENQK